MYKVEIAPESFEEAAIRRRRKLDEDRKTRIFDPKVRIIGIDVPALEHQIAVKNELERIEREREYAFDKTMKETNILLQHLDNETAESRRRTDRAVNDFRAAHQNPWQRRDFDLYDPDAKKKDLPARVGDSDPRNSVSGCQIFEGEDLSSSDRIARQRQQMRTWALEGIRERTEKKRQEDEEQRQYENFQRSVLQKSCALQKAVDDARRQIAENDNHINSKLGEWRRMKEAHDRAMEQEMNRQEIDRHLAGPFLTETPDVFNIGGGHKVRVDLFKGMTPEQKADVLRGQEQQRRENEAKLAKQREDEYLWALQDAANNRASLLLQAEKERQARELATTIRKQNEAKATEDTKRKLWTDRVLYTNPPTQAYFDQFNTTSR
ncbi:RIB43A-domain-containing protein [Cladochytrium replicatum]|nr:RIB43A-domain-containing protein [Cladochytrium replicatum]